MIGFFTVFFVSLTFLSRTAGVMLACAASRRPVGEVSYQLLLQMQWRRTMKMHVELGNSVNAAAYIVGYCYVI